MGPQLFRRPVLAIEELFAYSPRAFVAAATMVEGPVVPQRFAVAVARLQLHCPMLHCRIERDGENAPWFVEVPDLAPAQIVERRDDVHWREVLDAQWAIPFDLARGPFSRFILVHGEAASELLFVSQHATIDGVGKARIMDMLLRLLDDPNAPLSIPSDPPLPSGDAFASLAPRFSLRNLDIWLADRYEALMYAGIAFFWRRERSLHRRAWPDADVDPTIGAYGYRWNDECLTQDETMRLTQACKAQGVTVNTAMMVAFLAARHRVDPGNDNRRQMISIDLRRHLGREAQSAIGDYASSVDLSFRYDARRPFWDNARRYHRAMKRQLDANQDARKPRMLSRLPTGFLEMTLLARRMNAHPDAHRHHPAFPVFGPGSRHVVARYARAFIASRPTASISNIGVGRLAPRYGALTPKRCLIYPYCLSYPEAYVIISASIVERRLSYVLHVARPLLGQTPGFDQTMDALARAYRQTLTALDR